jgi:hypothetical protein
MLLQKAVFLLMVSFIKAMMLNYGKSLSGLRARRGPAMQDPSALKGTSP